MAVQTLTDAAAVPTSVAPAMSITVTAPAPSAPGASSSSSPSSSSSTASGTSFHQLLSELNPLQYLPVIGTIYRAVTGDTIPEPVRALGSLAVSGLLGGPIGIATNLGVLALEKATGIDPEEIGHQVLSALHLTSDTTATASAAVTPTTTNTAAAADSGGIFPPPPSAQANSAPTNSAPATAAAAPASSPAAQGWSPAQLAAYGIAQSPDGSLKFGTLAGADLLNQLELIRVNTAAPQDAQQRA